MLSAAIYKVSREFAKSEGTVLVGRWMSAEEYQKMVESGQVQEESYSDVSSILSANVILFAATFTISS